MTNYQELIISTKEYHSRVHRCFRDSIDKILKEGLLIGSGEMDSTSSDLPFDLESALNTYESGKDYGDSAVIIRIPRKSWENAKKKLGLSAGQSREISYFHPNKKEYTIKPEFVFAWIDRKTDEVHPNQYRQTPLPEGHEEYESMLG